MNTPSIRRGFLYPTTLQARCPRHHACLVTKKCQNYDKHNIECTMCESRVRPQRDLGGLLAEGEHVFDSQATVKMISEKMGTQFGDPNAEIKDTSCYVADTNEIDNLRNTLKQDYGIEAQLSPYAD